MVYGFIEANLSKPIFHSSKKFIAENNKLHLDYEMYVCVHIYTHTHTKTYIKLTPFSFQSGKSSSRACGSIHAPDKVCPPIVMKSKFLIS